MDLGPRWAGVSRDDAIGYPSGARLASGPERNAAVSWQIAYTKAEFPEAISARTVPSVQRNALVWTRRFSVNHQHTSGIRYPRQRDLSLRWRRNGEGKSKQAVVREYLIILEPSPKHWSTTPQAPHGSTKSAAGCRTDLTAASANSPKKRPPPQKVRRAPQRSGDFTSSLKERCFQSWCQRLARPCRHQLG